MSGKSESKTGSLLGRGLRYIRRYGPVRLCRKIKERRDRNRAEQGYEDWLFRELPGKEEGERQKKTRFSFSPLISVLVPAYETPEAFLREMMDSVLEQSYAGVELCIADGSLTDRVERTVREYARRDPRVRYQRLTENLGISENTNAALAMASGDYVGLLDHDDLLLPGALFEIVKALNDGEPADVVYTDEDKLDPERNRHFQPHFKPDFNPEYLRSNNYICHFFVAKRSLALETGGFRGEFDGAQDHDFIFRCTEKADRVLHVPKVLYSWRCHQASTAANPESKLYAYEAGKRAVNAHLERNGVKARVLDTENYGFYRVCYGDAPKILINSFEKFNGQTGVNVVYYDKACNNSVTISGKEDYVLFTCVRRGSINQDFWKLLFSGIRRPGAGIVCARVYGRDRRLLFDVSMGGVRDPFSGGMKGLKAGYSGYFHRALLQQELSRPTGCFLIRRSLLLELSGKEERIEVDSLCRKLLEKGYPMYYEPWAVMYEE